MFEHVQHHNEETQSLAATTPVTAATGAGIPVLANPMQPMASKDPFGSFSAFVAPPHSQESAFRGGLPATSGALNTAEQADGGMGRGSMANGDMSGLTSPQVMSFASPTCVTPPFSSSLSSPLMLSSLPSQVRCVTGGTPTSVLERPTLAQLAA